MAQIKTIKVLPGINLNSVVETASQSLAMQGFDVTSQVLGPRAAEVIVSKDRKGFKNSILGLGIECRAAITIENDDLSISISGEWTNKVLPAIIGWFLCWVPIVTDIVGIINQFTLPDKIHTALKLAVSSGSCYSSAAAEEATPVDFTPVEPEE